ncbi:MAG: hypothetical protein E7615_02105 [Ruminococcaceae bacterium]|nr:hypothetical protein [Oscillospiraceae bacterium]
MKAYVRHSMGVVGWMEKPDPVCGPDEVICRPLALCPCSSSYSVDNLSKRSTESLPDTISS